MTEKQFVEYIGPLAKADMKRSGVLASITAAQAILESGYGSSELAKNAHNLFGMKASLSGNRWKSSWSGATYTKNTKEWEGGRYVTVSAAFRKYGSDAESVRDHSDYLIGAMKGSEKRYAGIIGEKDPKRAAEIIKAGGYATSPTYVQSLVSVIEKWNLTKYDSEGGTEMNIIKKTGTHGMYDGAREIKYLVIHYTAGITSKPGSARDTAAWFANPNAGGTADFIVDDAEMVQYNPDPRTHACRAVGGNSYGNRGGRLFGQANNKNCISIEICSNNKAGKITNPNDGNWYFTEASLNNAIALAKYLMQQYGIPADRVIRHYDVNGKLCPGIIGWNADSGNETAWNAFKARLGGAAAAPAPAPSKPTASAPSGTAANFQYRVKITDLNIRKGPGMNYAVVGQCGNGVFTIVEEKDGWGHLKSGAGWISLNAAYGERVAGGAAAAPSEFKWAVTVPDLNIRKGPGTNYARTGKYTGKGTFTIVEQQNGWGRLKSGAGWISLNTAYGHKA